MRCAEAVILSRRELDALDRPLSGPVGSADRWAARINGRTVIVAARPGQLTT